MCCNIDKHLNNIQKVSEFSDMDVWNITSGDVAIGAIKSGIVGTIYLVSSLSSFILGTAYLRNTMRVDKNLTSKLNEIVDYEKQFVVHVVSEKAPNAFAIGGKHIFITKGLLNLKFTERELIAVMLHEAYHNLDNHVYKKLAYKHILFYLIIFVSNLIGSTSGMFPLGLLAFYLINKSANLAYDRIAGRIHEIKADGYAIKYGYGKDLVNGIVKIQKEIEKYKSQVHCGTVCKVLGKVDEMLDEHPPMKKRVEIILKKTNELSELLKKPSFNKIKNFVSSNIKEYK